MREALSAFPLLPRSLSSRHIKLTNKTMQALWEEKKKDFILMVLLRSYNKYNPPCNYLFSKKILVYKSIENAISCSTSVTEGSTNKTKQKIGSLWRQRFGFLAVILFDSRGANLRNKRHCLCTTAFCMLQQVFLSFPHLSKGKPPRNTHRFCRTCWIRISQEMCVWKSSPPEPCRGLLEYWLSWVAIAIRMGPKWWDKLEMILCETL